jgi:hypothetical protein
VRDCVLSKIGTEAGRGDVRDVFSTTLKFEPHTSKYIGTMADWKDRMADIIPKVGPFAAYPEKRGDAENVLAFSGNIKRNIGQ